MPRTPGSSPFTGQSLRGMELDVKLETQALFDCIFASTAFDVQVAAATTSRQHTLNKGSRTSTGAAGEITATCDVFVVPDSPGQWTINEAFRTGAKGGYSPLFVCQSGGRFGGDHIVGKRRLFCLVLRRQPLVLLCPNLVVPLPGRILPLRGRTMTTISFVN